MTQNQPSHKIKIYLIKNKHIFTVSNYCGLKLFKLFHVADNNVNGDDYEGASYEHDNEDNDCNVDSDDSDDSDENNDNDDNVDSDDSDGSDNNYDSDLADFAVQAAHSRIGPFAS